MSSSSSSQISNRSSPAVDSSVSPRPQLMARETTEMEQVSVGENGTAGSPMNLHKDVKRMGSPSDAGHLGPINMAERNGTLRDAGTDDSRPLNMSSAGQPKAEDKGQGHPERKRRASSDSLDSYQTKASESAADDVSKDDDDENDDDDDDKMSTSHGMDPERLKAFNMFVRLFVDENLDRMVPISKQPKDKIQAILDACDRQFPEFHERSRKRIRTYLKSCRRLRRSKDTANGWEQLRPTPPHLTSAAAEGLLATACENESNNAKRMRMGLDPVPPPAQSAAPAQQPAPPQPQQPPQQHTPSLSPALPAAAISSTQQSLSPEQTTASEKPSGGASELLRHATSIPTAFRPPHELPSPFFTNSNSIFRPGFPSTYQTPAHHHSPVIQHAPLASHVQNGPTDLSMKKSLGTSPSKSQLNSTEVATIKQLIAGYRESAAFLYRSADELEQLLLHQN